MKRIYEWDYESVDENGDIIDHNHADKLKNFVESDKTDTLVLVRDVCYGGGVRGRSWAYVEDGKLPEFFSDAHQRPMTRIPKRFHKELANVIG